MSKKYEIHPIDAVVYNSENHVKMLMCNNGCATTPIQRKEALLVQSVMNWYSGIDVPMLRRQIKGLIEISHHDIDTCDGIYNMLTSLADINEDLNQIDNIKHKDNIERDLINLYTIIGMDIPSNHEDITQSVYEYILDVVGLENYSNQDVSIGFRQWIESQNK